MTATATTHDARACGVHKMYRADLFTRWSGIIFHSFFILHELRFEVNSCQRLQQPKQMKSIYANISFNEMTPEQSRTMLCLLHIYARHWAAGTIEPILSITPKNLDRLWVYYFWTENRIYLFQHTMHCAVERFFLGHVKAPNKEFAKAPTKVEVPVLIVRQGAYLPREITQELYHLRLAVKQHNICFDSLPECDWGHTLCRWITFNCLID